MKKKHPKKIFPTKMELTIPNSTARQEEEEKVKTEEKNYQGLLSSSDCQCLNLNNDTASIAMAMVCSVCLGVHANGFFFSF